MTKMSKTMSIVNFFWVTIWSSFMYENSSTTWNNQLKIRSLSGKVHNIFSHMHTSITFSHAHTRSLFTQTFSLYIKTALILIFIFNDFPNCSIVINIRDTSWWMSNPMIIKKKANFSFFPPSFTFSYKRNQFDL